MIGQRQSGDESVAESTPRELERISDSELRELLRKHEKTDFSYLKLFAECGGKPNMTRVHFKGNFEGTDMSDMDAKRATFGAARVPGVNFSYADLRGTGGLDIADGLKDAHFYHTIVEKELRWKLEAATRMKGVTPDGQRFKVKKFEEPPLWVKRVC